MHPGERRQAHVAGGLGLVDRELQGGGAGRRSRRPGTARVRGSRPGTPRSAGSRAVATSPPRDRCGRRRRRTGAGCGPARRASRRGERAATGRRPSQPVLDLIGGLDAALVVAGGDRGARRRRASSRPGPTAGPARRRARGCDRSAPSPDGTRRDATRRRRGSSSSAPAGRRRRSRRPARWRRRCGRGRARGGRSTLRSTPRAGGRRPGLGLAAASPAASSAARIRCAPLLSPRTTQAQPNPLTMLEREQRVVRGAPGQGGVDVGALGPGERRGARPGDCCAHPAVEDPAASANHAACAARARSASPASAIASSANARMLSSSR